MSLPHVPQCTGDSCSREYTPCLFFFYEAASSYSGQRPDKEKSLSRKQPLLFFLTSILIFASLQRLLPSLTETDKSKHFLNLNISPQCVYNNHKKKVLIPSNYSVWHVVSPSEA